MKKGNPSFLVLSILISLLVFISLACSVNNQGNNADLAATQESLQQTQVALSVEQTLIAMQQSSPVPSAEATEGATAAPVPEETANSGLCTGKTNVSYQNISFCYDPSLASGTNNTIEAAQVSEMSENFSTPQHVQFAFQGYQISPTFHDAVIHIYPVQEYISISPYSANIINNLQTMLQQQPPSPSGIPFLPMWNAAQMFSTQKAYLQFQNGQGIRFLTQYGQSYWPINNEDLFYTFQGLTNDGQYYVSAILPISNPVLPANGDAWPGDLNDLAESYELNYTENMSILLYSQSDDSFTPTLTILDELIESITITQ